jgi:hypothetical protein
MGLRLSSVLGGAATRGSERLKTLEEDTKKLITTEAARVAKELEDTRKERTKNRLDYNKAARQLKTQYKLSDGQVETLLAGGLQNVEAFSNAIKAGQARAYQEDRTKPFDALGYAQGLFSATQEGVNVPSRSISEQADAFASMMAPMPSSLMTSAEERIGKAVTGMGAARAPKDFISSTLAAQTRALGGEAPVEFTGAELGTTGMTVKGLGELSPTDLIALRKAEADVASTEALTDVRKAQVGSINQDAALTKEKIEEAQITNKGLEDRLGAEADKVKATVDQIIANTGLAEARAKTEGISADKMQKELELLEEFGEEERQAALDLVEAQIYEKGSYNDLEAYQVGQLRIKNSLQDKLNNTEDPTERAALEKRIKNVDSRISDAAIALSDDDTTTDYFKNAVQPENVFQKIIQRNAQGLDVGTELSPFSTEITLELGPGKMPQYFTAIATSIDEFGERFAYKQKGNKTVIKNQMGADAALAFAKSFDNQIKAFANSQGFIDAGFKNYSSPTAVGQGPRIYSMDEINELEKDAKPGSVVIGRVGNRITHFVMSSAGEFIAGIGREE